MQEQKELIAQCLLKVLISPNKYVKNVLQEDGSFYICGDAKSMANDVHKALLECFTTAGGLSYDQAEAAVAKMKADKRYLTDVWA